MPKAEQDSNVSLFVTGIKELCSQLCNIGQELKSGELQQEMAAAMEGKYSRELNRICKTPLVFNPAEALRKFLVGSEHKHLFTFLRHPGVAPTNNHAEQSIRRLVIFRKVSFGTRSQSGLKTHSVLPSLVLTAKRQGVEPIDFMKILLTQNTEIAQAALYQNTS